jgi:hypothetical protein
MLAEKDYQIKLTNYTFSSFEMSLRRALNSTKSSWVWSVVDYSYNINFRWLKNVTSIQRMEVEKMIDAHEIAKLYFAWLPVL